MGRVEEAAQGEKTDGVSSLLTYPQVAQFGPARVAQFRLAEVAQFRPAYSRLEVVPDFHLERPFLTTQTVANNQANLHLSCEVFAKSHSLQKTLHPWKNT